MTNWMTAAGLALIAGGLATLISFRSVLFGGGERRAGRRQRRAVEAPRRRAALAGPVFPAADPASPAAEAVPAAADAAPVPDERLSSRFEPVPGECGPGAEERAVADVPRRRGRRGRRRALVPAGSHTLVPEDEDERGSLASIGFAADEDVAAYDVSSHDVAAYDDAVYDVSAHEVSAHDEEAGEPAFPDRDELIFAYEEQKVIAREDLQTLLPEEPVPAEPAPPARNADRYGDRIEGWVRPEYQSPADEPRPGEYWTPIPVDLGGGPEPSAKGYGWPLPVERLPAVPAYQPATGFDLVPVPSEPTEVVPVWSAGDQPPSRIRLPRSWSGRNEKPGREPRRRPRPRPQLDTPAENRTVYVSRHAADPPH